MKPNKSKSKSIKKDGKKTKIDVLKESNNFDEEDDSEF